MKTIVNSDLKWRIYKIHYIGEKYVKARILFFYKNSNKICNWLNPLGCPKNFKILKENYLAWETLYEID